MKIKAGYELTYECPQPTPMLLCLNIHPSRRADLLTPQDVVFSPAVKSWDYLDSFGNACTRVTAPAGPMTVSTEFIIHDTGRPDYVPLEAVQHDVRDLPDEVLLYLLGSRYCETDKLGDIAWSLFGHTAPGWPRVQAVLDFVHGHIRFDYQLADKTRSAFDAYQQKVGVCRDFAHLALTLCRCLNIPARYCTGYLGDIKVDPVPAPMDFSGWFEVFLGGHWYTADARHNTPRVGRILMAIGRDATDVAISTQFGPGVLSRFEVVTEEAEYA
ncbi:transglutaminase family protein [Asticcacaulis sp. ZE23SCel15]|uniref:transglutaminase-like domain-containing protein n=1 Tax=Asticcacaulis sp. ZE23SCel15 TaxID=3059027 RepID=UPI00265E1D2C|nr:transglutaminase family protein [Asticcacaulis sp. ZE23SCel15]WKL56160.1 transglutaminase family protein [Asticcacaulis sp. ZE23SCel15]